MNKYPQPDCKLPTKSQITPSDLYLKQLNSMCVDFKRLVKKILAKTRLKLFFNSNYNRQAKQFSNNL